MPIYEYKCECGKNRELFSKTEERKDFIRCDCSENIYMKRVITHANFKVNGFNEKTDTQEKKNDLR